MKRRISVFKYSAGPWQVTLLKGFSRPTPSRCCPGQPHSGPLTSLSHFPNLGAENNFVATTATPVLLGWESGRLLPILPMPLSLLPAQSWNEASRHGVGLGRVGEKTGTCWARSAPEGLCDGSKEQLRSLNKAPAWLGEMGKNIMRFTPSHPDLYLISSYCNTAFCLLQSQEVLGLIIF